MDDTRISHYPPARPLPVNTARGSRAYAARLDALLAYIVRYIGEHQRPPTFREIMDALGVPSTSIVAYRLAALERRGDIRIDRGIARGITVNRPIHHQRGHARPTERDRPCAGSA